MFIQKNFDENDARARAKAKTILIKHYDKVEDNPDVYDIDLLCYRNNKIVAYVEVEVKNLWQGQNFPYPDINALTRKEKYYKAHPDNCILILFNGSLTSCFLMNGKTILASPKVEVPNRRHASGEYFFKVPISKVLQLKDI